jgi:cell wall-associated NlpC family hydrolase
MPLRSSRRLQPQFEGLEVRELLSASALPHTPVARQIVGPGPTNATDPDFDPSAGRLREQVRASSQFLRVENRVLTQLAGHAVSSPLTQANARANPFEWFYKIFGKEQNQAIENLYDNVGPKNPFVGLPHLTEAQLEPGDIIATTSADLLSQATRIATWSRFSHVALYVGNGMIEDATGIGVKVRPLDALLAHSSADGVMRDDAVSDAQLATVVTDALKYLNKPYNFAGFAAIATEKSAGVAEAASRGISSVIAVLSRAETLPASVTNGDAYFCSQLIMTAYADAGISFNIANGPSPGDVVRLSQDGPLTELGSLPIGQPPVG